MNEKLKSLASKTVILIVGVLAIGSVALAFSGSSQVEIETCDGCLFGASQSEELGASGTRFPNGISADATSPVTGEVRGATLTVTGASSFLGSPSITQSTSSTLTIGSASSVACLQMYNAVGSGLVYVTVASSTISATTTKPAACP